MTDQEDRSAQQVALVPNEAVRIALQMHRGRKLDVAERLYRMTLQVAPDHPDALHWLGVLLYDRKMPDEGRNLIERSIELVPGHPDYHNNYGNALQSTEAFAEAEREYRRCLELHPNQPQVLCNLGVCLRKSGRPDEAVAAYQQALSIDGGQPDAYYNLASLLQKQDKLDEATGAFKEVIAHRPDYEPAYRQLSRLYYAAGRIDDAAQVYRLWTEANPDHPVPRHMLAACTGEAIPERTSPAAVRHTFDGFAESFDKVLDGLDYIVPQVICRQAEIIMGIERPELDILDIGCGTGLCGTLLKPLAQSLVGVDLSPNMLAKARQREVYDGLHEADFVAYMRHRSDAFDLIVCADSLCYFGLLESVFAAVRQALRRAGLFIFSVESADRQDRVSSYQLHPHGRYAHRSEYVRSALRGSGLRVLDARELSLRRELGEPVPGWVFTAGR